MFLKLDPLVLASKNELIPCQSGGYPIPNFSKTVVNSSSISIIMEVTVDDPCASEDFF